MIAQNASSRKKQVAFAQTYFAIKKPVVIEAVQYLGQIEGQCIECNYTEAHIHTIHDNQIVFLEIGDWIINEPDGKHQYPCKPDAIAEQ